MKKLCKSIFLTLLLLAGAASAYSDPSQGRGQGGRQQGQAQPKYDGERDNQRETQREMQRNERNVGDADPNAPTPSRNNGRMTPEERSALRRQINEAGQDIYSGKYKR
ncbi:MAG: hypothetical protein ACOH2B_13205 [Burkholderiaceae bacterium]